MATQFYTAHDQLTQAHKAFIKKHGDLGVALLKEHNYDVERAIQAMEEHYQGKFNSREDFAKSIMQEVADELPKEYKFARHILRDASNWEHVAWELFLGDYTDIEVGNKIHVFRSF